MTYTAWRNWEAMRIQNRIMRRQIKQTDRIIEHMRDERRPWVNLVDARLEQIEIGKRLRLHSRLENSGSTPATAYKLAIGICFAEDLHDPGLAEFIDSQNLTPAPCTNLVPPSGGCEQHATPGKITDVDVSEISSEKKWLIVTGALLYGGPASSLYETGFAFACRTDGVLRVVGGPTNNYTK